MKTNANKQNVHKHKFVFYPWIKFRSQCQDMRLVWKTQGFKALVKQYGWRFFLLVFCYYLVRDVTLYILLPYLVAKISMQ